MTTWRDSILNDFVPQVSKLTLVADPDALLSEEKLALALRERGFDLIEFQDPIEFRYAYETQYRSIWDQGEHTDLVVILRLEHSELDGLPYDLLQAGRKLSFNLGDLFPNLSYPVIEKLDRGLLDPLYEAQQRTSPDPMGDNATKDFILRHVFGIAAELITSDVELLRALLRLHYGHLQLPAMLAIRLVQVLNTHSLFSTWPLAEIVGDSISFFAFLQERWPVFLSRIAASGQTKEIPPAYGLKYPGPDTLPFDHQDIRVYIDNLFVEGRLAPVSAPELTLDADSWIRSGITCAGAEDDSLRLSRLMDRIREELPSETSRHSDWTSFAYLWAELSRLMFQEASPAHHTPYQELGEKVYALFGTWLEAHYASLVNLPPSVPVMVHHVARRLARDVEDHPDRKVALVVMDGLALHQWGVVRQSLQSTDPGILFRESAVFAWVPTLTSVSRQAIFSGKSPFYFPSSIHTTNNEEKLWKQFWEGIGLTRLEIAYQRGLGQGDPFVALQSVLGNNKTRVLGLVVDTVDKIMHGMQLGSQGMLNQIQQWCQEGYLRKLLACLMDKGFEVWLTADHGNLECEGRGRPSEGVIAETRGERVRVYPTGGLREQIEKSHSHARAWDPVGLPSGFFPLLAGDHAAFASVGERIVGHGGASIEEMLVPLVKLERKDQA